MRASEGAWSAVLRCASLASDSHWRKQQGDPPTGDGSPPGRARGRGLRSYAALRLRPRQVNTPIGGREPVRAHRGACMYCRAFELSPSVAVCQPVKIRLAGFRPLCGLLLVFTFNRPLCAKSERLRAKNNCLCLDLYFIGNVWRVLPLVLVVCLWTGTSFATLSSRHLTA